MYIVERVESLRRFFLFTLCKFRQQRCTETAASLSYTSLLSLVPLLAVLFAGFSIFPVFQELFNELQEFIFKNFIPSSSEVIKQYLTEFVGKASRLTLVGLLSLFVIALMLLWSIDESLNKIWGTKKNTNYLRVFLTYWAVLTFGPILIGTSVIVTSYLTSLSFISDTVELLGIRTVFWSLVPISLTLISFTLVYLIIPNAQVRFTHALIGGIMATLLFEAAKEGFAYYISHNTTYTNLYGTLAALPIFLIWLYISWLVTLWGAVTTRCMDLFDFSAANEQNYIPNQFVSALHLLRVLSKASQDGHTLTEDNVYKTSQLNHEKYLNDILVDLQTRSWIHKTENGHWALSRDLSSISLWDFYNDLPYALPKSVAEKGLSDIIDSSNQALEQQLNIPLKQVFINVN
jgi:membrane protein